jgi:hypothetical protein
LSKTCYDPKIDYEILKIIDRDKETRFNILVVEIGNLLTIQLRKKEKNLNKIESMGIRRTIRRHLEFLSGNKNKILLWTRPTTPGKVGSIKYTTLAEIKRRYGFLTIDYSGKRGICRDWKKNENVKEIEERKRKKKTILFLIIAIAYGYTGYKITSEPIPGSILIKDEKGKLVDVSVYSEKGFSIEDFDREDFQLSAIHNILRINRFTRSEIGEMLEDLKKNKDIILRSTIGTNGKEERYYIEDDGLKELFIWCYNILKNFVNMMKQYWYILGKKPKPEETEWFSFIVGENVAVDVFTKIEDNKASKKKKTIRELFAEYHFKALDLDKKMVDIERVLEETEAFYRDKYHIDIFTKKGMEEYIFKHSRESITLHNHCKLIAGEFKESDNDKKYHKYDRMKYQKLVNTKKYQWVFEELADLVNPPFSRSKYKVKLT